MANLQITRKKKKESKTCWMIILHFPFMHVDLRYVFILLISINQQKQFDESSCKMKFKKDSY